MTKTHNDIVVTSRVRLARNYHDLPFSNRQSPENARLCIERAREAFDAGDERMYTLYLLDKTSENLRQRLFERHLISSDLLQLSDMGAVLIRQDSQVSVMINEEDQLRIQAMRGGMRLGDAAGDAFDAEERLQRNCSFSFDPQLGYLTACPTNTGTGMRASLMLHLPMLTSCKQMGNVTQSVAKLGLTIRGIYGEGSEAQGDLYQVSNQVTLGRTENEIIEAVIAVGKQLIDLERGLRVKAESRIELCDRVQRSYGLVRYARLMGLDEFMTHWSNLRLGAALGWLPVTLNAVDELLTTAQDAHAAGVLSESGEALPTEQARCVIIRQTLENAPQEGK